MSTTIGRAAVARGAHGTTRRPFGLTFSSASPPELAALALTERRRTEDGVALVVTPNIDHIAWLRRSPGMAAAYAHAAAIVCDGWPVQLYARACGLAVRRVTGCEIAAELMRGDMRAGWQRLFFVVDKAETETALHEWASRKGIGDRVETFVPPFGFEDDNAVCRSLADKVRAFGTTTLLMGVGAPRSEIFVDRFRDRLPPCWAFCVGQAVKIELGMVRRAPRSLQRIGLEWFWRLGQEPQRLAGRYLWSSLAFAAAVVEDQWRLRVRRDRSCGGVA